MCTFLPSRLRYIDRGIQIKQGFEIEKLEADGLVFSDGSKVEADAIVLAYVHRTAPVGLSPYRVVTVRDTHPSSIPLCPYSARRSKTQSDQRSGD